jgi:DNA mismatch repair protein MutL
VPESAAAEVEIPTPAAATTAGAEAPASAAGSAAEAAAAPTEETAPADERALLGTRGPRVIGQLGGTFILLEDRGDLLLVDQHTAHERVLFERLRAARQQGNVPVQQLLVPLVLQLTPAEEQLLREHQEELETLGFRIEEFGNRSFAVHSCPAILRKLDLQQLVPELLADLSELGGSSRTQGLIDEVTMSIACKAAVKAHAPLDPVQLQALIDQLFQTGTPGTCPHGRPIVLRINRRDIEKFFQR